MDYTLSHFNLLVLQGTLKNKIKKGDRILLERKFNDTTHHIRKHLNRNKIGFEINEDHSEASIAFIII